MHASIRIARISQLVGAGFMIVGMGSCTQRDSNTAGQLIAGFGIIIAAKIFEWLTKE